MKKTITFMRHGETELNKARKGQGWCDSYLTENGEMQIKQAAERFKDIHFDLIISSPLGRTMTTTKSISKHHNVPVISSSLVMEYSMGIHERADLNDEVWVSLREKFYIDGGRFQGGESISEVHTRINTMMRDLFEKEEFADKKDILIVCHGGVIHSILLENVESREEKLNILNTPIPNTSTIHQVLTKNEDDIIEKKFINFEDLKKKL